MSNINDILSSIITNDEGGFVLTHNANDPDGGWTYGGIIRGNWYNPVCNYTLEQMQSAINAAPGTMKATCIAVYNDKFVTPSRVAELPSFIQQCYLSAVINCGQSVAVEMLQLAYNKLLPKNTVKVDGVIGSETIHAWGYVGPSIENIYKLVFCDAWEDHYFDIVVANTEDWVDFCTKVGQKHPGVNFSADLRGWINRVRRNRDA